MEVRSDCWLLCSLLKRFAAALCWCLRSSLTVLSDHGFPPSGRCHGDDGGQHPGPGAPAPLQAGRHQEREERRREMEFVPKARYEDWGEERDDDL